MNNNEKKNSKFEREGRSNGYGLLHHGTIFSTFSQGISRKITSFLCPIAISTVMNSETKLEIQREAGAMETKDFSFSFIGYFSRNRQQRKSVFERLEF